DAAIRPHLFTDALIALLVLHVHAASVGGNADVVSNKNQHSIRVGIFAVLLDGVELVFVRAGSEESLHAFHKENLERSHQRWCTGTVEDFGKISLCQIKIKQAEVPQLGWNQMFKNGFATTLAEENFVADKYIRGTQLARLHFTHEAVGLCKCPH